MRSLPISNRTTGLVAVAALVGGALLYAKRIRPLDTTSPAPFSATLLTAPSGRPASHLKLWNQNAENFSRSFQEGRNLISEIDVRPFLDPAVPIDKLFKQGSRVGEGVFGTVDVWTDGAGGAYAIKRAESALTNDFLIGLHLDHPNVVRIHHLVTKINPRDGQPVNYLIMELVEGVTLGQANLNDLHRLSLVEQMSESLTAMLNRGVGPGDLHRHNIMVTHQGQLKWIDLGGYKWIDGSQTVGQLWKNIKKALRLLTNPLTKSDSAYGKLHSLVEKTQIGSISKGVSGMTTLSQENVAVVTQCLEMIREQAIAVVGLEPTTLGL